MKQFSVDCLKIKKESSMYISSLLRSAREEIDLPFDQDEYNKIMTKAWEKEEQNVKLIRDFFQNEIDNVEALKMNDNHT